MNNRFTSVSFIEYHYNVDRRTIDMAIEAGCLPHPKQYGNALGWDDEVLNSINIGAALETVQAGAQADDLDLSSLGIDPEKLAAAIARRQEGRQGIDASEFVTVNHILAHYNRSLEDLSQTVQVGVLPHPIVNFEGTAEGWPAAVFAFHENALREAWAVNDDEGGELPENPWQGFNQPDDLAALSQQEV